MQLREYQKAAIEATYDYLRTQKGNPCIVAPTGSGKSPIISAICSDTVTRWSGRVLVLAHVKELLEQTAGTLRKINPLLEVGVYSAGLKSRDTTSPVIVAGIQSVYRRACELDRFDLILVDECHLLPPDGEGMYQTFLKDAKVVNPRVRLIGLTATPFRLKSGLLCGPDNLLTDVCYEIGIKQLIEQGYLSPLRSRSSRYKVDCSALHIRGGEFVPAEVDALVDTDDNVQNACREIVSLTADRKSVLVFAVSVKHAEHVKRTLEKITSQECGIVTGDTISKERDVILRRFKQEKFVTDLLGTESPPLKYLVNVNVLTTGFDAPNIDCVVLLRPTASAGLYAQMCLDMETEVLTPSGWRRCHEITTGDIVGAFDTQTENIVYVTAEDKVHRALRRNESMYGILSPRLDIRVTNNHNMIVRCKGQTCLRWQLQTAEHIAMRSDGYHIPLAGKGANYFSEAELSDAEVSFLGWFLTDGYRSRYNGTITISQSDAKFHEEIRQVLNDCGFGFREYHQKRSGKLERYDDNHLFVVPYSTPRGEQAGKKGWFHLEAWIDKDLPSIYNSLSKRQFRILLESMNLANGQNRDMSKLDYTPRTMTIALGCRRRLADRIQQMAVERGFRCDVRSFQQKPSDWNRFPQEQWMVAICEKTTAFVGGTRKDVNEMIPNRCHFGPISHTPNEWVWCLTTEKGTLVTRRNGKVAIVGNCGRGFRLHESKADCLVLDYGGNILRHGPIDAIQVKDKKAKSGGEAPMKECPKCFAVLHAAMMQCPDCSYQFQKPEASEKHDGEAASEGVLTGEICDTRYDVSDVAYSVHTKRGAAPGTPNTMKVEYKSGLCEYVSEWVCPEHDGWARQKFETWWTERSNNSPPKTAADAVRLAQHGSLAAPTRITVRKISGDKFPKILKYELPPIKPPPVEMPTDDDYFACGDDFQF